MPKLRKTVVDKVALAVGAMIERRTPNTAELANVLPLATERQDLREQWLRRLLKNPLLSSPVLLALPVARERELARRSRIGRHRHHGRAGRRVHPGGLPDLRLVASEVPTNVGILHEAGHPEPWIIAMDGVAPGRRGGIRAAAGASNRWFRTSKVAVLTCKPPSCAPRIGSIACS